MNTVIWVRSIPAKLNYSAVKNTKGSGLTMKNESRVSPTLPDFFFKKNNPEPKERLSRRSLDRSIQLYTALATYV